MDAESETALVLGIMSGTSLDGVDYASCRISPDALELAELRHSPFPRDLRDRLARAAADELSAYGVGQLHHDLGRFYASAARRRFPRGRFSLAGLHGQTIYHQPRRPHAATMQLGEPAYLARAFTVPVVSNFRAMDMAAGGEGAPLVTPFHVTVFGRPGRHVCVQNLGGIGNVTSIDWRRPGFPLVTAFDTGPGNLLLNAAATHFSHGRNQYDVDGRWAREGRVREPLLERWLRHPFYRRRPPKSTGREMFGEDYFGDLLGQCQTAGVRRADVFATLTELTARSIAVNYRHHLATAPDQVVLAGGGASNGFLIRRIADNLVSWKNTITVTTTRTLGWPHASVEPAAFAFLAWCRWHGIAAHFPGTTGASESVLLGQITEP